MSPNPRLLFWLAASLLCSAAAAACDDDQSDAAARSADVPGDGQESAGDGGDLAQSDTAQGDLADDLAGADAAEVAVLDTPVSDLPPADGPLDASQDPPPDQLPDLPTEDASGDTADVAVGTCHTSADCSEAFEQCLAPGEFLGCGICRDPEDLGTCEIDDDCPDEEGTGRPGICEPSRTSDCLCSPAKVCRFGCRDDVEADCAESEFCDPLDHRCLPDVCLIDENCPDHFECRPEPDLGFPEGNPRCFRARCEGAQDCPDGECVNGLCYDQPGTCSPIPG
jgi:hypothetical protein